MSSAAPGSSLPDPEDSVAYSEVGLKEDEPFVQRAATEAREFVTASLNARIAGSLLFGVERRNHGWKVQYQLCML